MLRKVRFWQPNGGSKTLVLLCSETGSTSKIGSCWIISGLFWNAVMYFMVFGCCAECALSEASGLFLALVPVQAFLDVSCKSGRPWKFLFRVMLLCSVISLKWAVIYAEKMNGIMKKPSLHKTMSCCL